MKRPIIYLLTCLAAGTLVACSDSTEATDPVTSSQVSSPLTPEDTDTGDGQVTTSSNTPMESPNTSTEEAPETGGGALPEDGAAEFGVTEEEKRAANAVYSRLRGTSLEQETLITVVVGGRATCNLMNPGKPEFYDPDALEGLMRDAYYSGGGKKREMSIPAVTAEEFCPDLYPGDDAVDQLTRKITTSG